MNNEKINNHYIENDSLILLVFLVLFTNQFICLIAFELLLDITVAVQ